MERRLFLLHGYFGQAGTALVPILDPQLGASVGIAKVNGLYQFAGRIFTNPHDVLCGLTGTLEDQCGVSRLSEIWLDPEREFKFTKTYERRTDPITYTFTPDGKSGIWYGTYQGPNVGSGQAICIITEVPATFGFQPPEGPVSRPEAKIVGATQLSPRLLTLINHARENGYELDPCPNCNAFAVKRNGEGSQCEKCGETSLFGD